MVLSRAVSDGSTHMVESGRRIVSCSSKCLTNSSPEMRVTAPASIAGRYQFGTAEFGPPVGQPDVSSAVVAAMDAADGSGPSTTDGCTAFTNAGDVAGKIALVERGTCGFAVKARNATSRAKLSGFDRIHCFATSACHLL